MDNIVIAVGGLNCGVSPLMPYIGERFDGKDFTTLAALHLSTALLRCGFDVLDTDGVSDPQDMILQANRHNVDAAILVSYTAFGSRKSFNDVHGSVVRYSQGRFTSKSRILAEDVCSKLMLVRESTTAPDGMLGAANCETAIVDAGYLTCFDEAKLSHDPDFAVNVAEHVAMGICEHFGMPYVRRDDILSYPMLCSAATGKRGKKIKMLQALLCANGYRVAVDGVFGKATDTAVKTLCINNGRTGDDGVSAAVWRDLLLLNLPNLELGSKSNAVLYLQRKLHSKLYKAPMNGVLDSDTMFAVGEYLSENTEGVTAPERGVSNDILKLISPVGGGRPRLF